MNRHTPGLRRSADLARISRSRSTSSFSTQYSFPNGEAQLEKSEPFALCHSPTVVGPAIYQQIIWLSRVCSISEQRRSQWTVEFKRTTRLFCTYCAGADHILDRSPQTNTVPAQLWHSGVGWGSHAPISEGAWEFPKALMNGLSVLLL